TPYQRILRIWNRDEGEWDEVESSIEPFAAEHDYIVMVNGMGGTPISELYGVYRRLAHNCEQAGFRIVRNMVGNFCTSLDMEGVSITFLKADKEMLELFDAPVDTAAIKW
ncbi:dihydroxyacetone kinase subunit DhaK, partial [Vibrio parahaemolyticus]|nr:dihydroxyacetone kinase subunit DhaK [Vibrio parahaemolyticus]